MKLRYILIVALCTVLHSCRKWLDVKSNISDVTPSTLADYQAIADNDATLNVGTPVLGLLSNDNYYVSYANWQPRSAIERNSYIWAAEVYEGFSPQDWSRPYKNIELMNIVLEGVDKIAITADNQSAWNLAKGSALFTRALAYYNLAQIFAPPYNAATASGDAGVPIRSGSDVNEISVRPSVADNYQLIISDLKTAAELLPASPAYQTRPSKAAAYTMLAKAYLNMGNYALCFENADKALAINNTLIDFNTINAAATISFSAYPNNKEVVYYSVATLYTIIASTFPTTDSVLYQSYAANDLRKTVLYRLNANLPVFKGSYTGAANSYFSGIGVNELYLLRAEASARLGNITAAISDLNTLLQKRWKTGTYVAMTASSADDALSKVLTEKRKELPFTGNTRWEDLRRLNMDTRFAKTLTRQLNGTIYTLAPNDKRYVLPIPDEEIRLSGIAQNPR